MQIDPRRSEARDALPDAAAGDGRFGPDYYRRYYGDRRTRVSDLAAVRRLLTFLKGYLAYLRLPVRSVLDVGCGTGQVGIVCRELWPRARYHGFEYSEHLCERYGFAHGSAADFDPQAAFGRDRFDLVVCRGVMQYLDDRAAARALHNLGRWTAGALYLEALTERDWQENCDRERTDGDVELRPGSYYRRRLARDFQTAGGGLFVARSAGVAMFELEGG